MARGKKTGGRDFQKGQVANPAGRPPVPEEVKELRKLNRLEVEEKLSEYLRMPLAEFTKLANDPKTSTLDLMIMKVVSEAVKKGDHVRLNFLLDRIIGKVPDRIADGDGQPLMSSFVDLMRIAASAKKGNS